MNEKSSSNIITTSIEQLSSLIRSATILGEPIVTGEHEVLIPISRVMFGFGSGAADMINKIKSNETVVFDESSLPCAGGILGGVAIMPEALVYLSNGEFQIIDVKRKNSTFESVATIVYDFIKSMNKKKGKEKHSS